jgi:hypothetical protein
MERILALQALNVENGIMNDPVLDSTKSHECSSETTQGCSTQSNNCTGTAFGMEMW